MVLVFDIGGTSTKIAILDDNKNFVERDSIVYQKEKDKLEEADDLLINIKNKIKLFISKYQLDAICFSTCGIIDEDGTIWGAYAINDYSKINWKRDLKEFNLPVYVENDASCSLLAEYKYGAGKGYSNLILLVFGTGVGGALVVNNHIFRGLSGEFGCFLEELTEDGYINFSTAGSPRNTEIQLNKVLGNNKYFSEYIEEYKTDPMVRYYIDKMIFIIAKNILNISFVINPEVFIIGGGISENEWVIKKIQDKVKELISLSGFELYWEVIPAQFKNDANLLGAYSLYKGGD